MIKAKGDGQEWMKPATVSSSVLSDSKKEPSHETHLIRAAMVNFQAVELLDCLPTDRGHEEATLGYCQDARTVATGESRELPSQDDMLLWATELRKLRGLRGCPACLRTPALDECNP